MVKVSLDLTTNAVGGITAVLKTAGPPADDVKMVDADLRLPGNAVNLIIIGVPPSRLQAGVMKLTSGPIKS